MNVVRRSFSQGEIMRRVSSELLEYLLIFGLIVVAVVAVIGAVTTIDKDAPNSVSDSQPIIDQ